MDKTILHKLEKEKISEIDGEPYWRAPNYRDYFFPKSYINEKSLATILQRLKKDGLLSTRKMILQELGLNEEF